jgi:superfamily II DNA/RNA helicase
VGRIGRTARAGHEGKATAFFSSRDLNLAGPLVRVLREANQPVPQFLAEEAGMEMPSEQQRLQPQNYGGYDYRQNY